MGYGTGPFGIGSLGLPATPQITENPSDLSSSRKIDGVLKVYVQNDDGGYESMDDTDQRVLLLMSFANVETKFITPSDMNNQANLIRAALTPVTSGRDPDIKIISVTVERSASQTTTKTLTYKNLRKNTQKTVKA